MRKIADPSINGWYYVTVWNKLYRREILEGIEFPIKKIHEDEYVIHEIIFNCEKIVSISAKLYKYVQREGSIMSTLTKINALDAIEAICNRVQFYEENQLNELQANLIKRLKSLYDNRRFDIVQPQNRAERKRVREIDKMFRKMYFKYESKHTIRTKLKYQFPTIWKQIYCWYKKI